MLMAFLRLVRNRRPMYSENTVMMKWPLFSLESVGKLDLTLLDQGIGFL